MSRFSSGALDFAKSLNVISKVSLLFSLFDLFRAALFKRGKGSLEVKQADRKTAFI